MSATIKIKRILALLLLACVFMPLAKCTVKPSIFNNIQTTQTTVKYAYSMKDGQLEEPIITVLSFVWPLLLLLLCLRYSQLNNKVFYKLIELVLCCWTTFALFITIMFKEPLYGSFIAAFSILLYFLITIFELFLLIRSKILGRRKIISV